MPTKQKWTQAEIADEAVRFDWSSIRDMSDDEIAAADPDSYVPTDDELRAAVEARAKRVRKPAAE